MTTTFSVSWDYRCPFARNAHEHLVDGLRAGAGWQVTFVPFALDQVHVEEGGTDVWDDPAKAAGLLAMQAAIVVRDRFGEKFLDVHSALFRARHDERRDIREESVVRSILDGEGIDTDLVFKEIGDGWPLEAFRIEHQGAARDHSVWGVPTFIAGDHAVFVRLMTRPAGDGELAKTTIDRVLGLVTGFPELNEFKHSSISN